jgi:hypothetical protein
MRDKGKGRTALSEDGRLAATLVALLARRALRHAGRCKMLGFADLPLFVWMPSRVVERRSAGDVKRSGHRRRSRTTPEATAGPPKRRPW